MPSEIIGPNSCPDCGGEYGKHTEICEASPPPSPAPEPKEVVAVPTMEERELWLRQIGDLLFRSGHVVADSDPDCADCKMMAGIKAVFAALAVVESQLEQVETRSDEWKQRYINTVHERDATVESITAQRDSAIEEEKRTVGILQDLQASYDEMKEQRDSALKSLGERDRALHFACETIVRIRPSSTVESWREAFRHQAALEVKPPEQAAEEFRQRNIGA